jgi:hypothetical protein
MGRSPLPLCVTPEMSGFASVFPLTVSRIRSWSGCRYPLRCEFMNQKASEIFGWFWRYRRGCQPAEPLDMAFWRRTVPRAGLWG